jgi:hypothetical protein
VARGPGPQREPSAHLLKAELEQEVNLQFTTDSGVIVT